MVSVEQLRALEVLEKEKSFHRAARALGKSYGAFSYLIKSLEDELGLKLLDRSGYRTRFTAEGRAVLQYGARIQQDHENFLNLCRGLRSGWEPRVQIVSDGILDQKLVVKAICALRDEGVSTQIATAEAYLEEVEEEFRKRNADMMIAVAPLRVADLPSFSLRPSRLLLVCSRLHPLARGRRWRLEDLKKHDLVNVKTAPTSLVLSTSELELRPTFTVGDFHSKLAFIRSGLAFGWLPEEMIPAELKAGTLVKIRGEIANAHVIRPRLYHRPVETLGKASRRLITHLRARMGGGRGSLA
jgi:DNA-binding transcriptional LysR family regulator